MNPNQKLALKKLEAAFLSCKRAGIVFVGCENGIIAAPLSDELKAARDAFDSIHAILDDASCYSVKTYDCYWDSGSP